MSAKRRTAPAKSAAPAPVVPPVEGNLLRVGLPKGSLQEATLELMRHAGFDLRTIERSYHASCDDPEVRGILVRAQEMARYVEQGLFDCGLTGLDWVKENRAKVVHVCDLVYSKVSRRPVRWVVAVPNASPIKSVEDLQGKRIATEAVNLVKDYLRRHKVTAEVEFSWGATEIKVPELVDAIVDVTETGSSLRAHNLRIVDTVLESWTQFIASHEAMRNPWKRDKIESIAMLLQAAMAAEGRVGLKMNAPRKLLPSILEILPALKSPTISTLSNSEFVAVETILEKAQVRELIPKLKRAGASGIIEYPLNKVVE